MNTLNVVKMNANYVLYDTDLHNMMKIVEFDVKHKQNEAVVHKVKLYCYVFAHMVVKVCILVIIKMKSG